MSEFLKTKNLVYIFFRNLSFEIYHKQIIRLSNCHSLQNCEWSEFAYQRPGRRTYYFLTSKNCNNLIYMERKDLKKFETTSNLRQKYSPGRFMLKNILLYNRKKVKCENVFLFPNLAFFPIRVCTVIITCILKKMRWDIPNTVLQSPGWADCRTSLHNKSNFINKSIY